MTNVQIAEHFNAAIDKTRVMLSRIGNNVNYALTIAPMDITQMDVDTVLKLNADLENITDWLFNEGEYAK